MISSFEEKEKYEALDTFQHPKHDMKDEWPSIFENQEYYLHF